MNLLLLPTDPRYMRDLFNHSARYYEWVNNVTSLGQVHLWRREVIRAACLQPEDQVLDAFCGPGALAARALPHLSETGRLVLADLSPVMLQQAHSRIERVRDRLAQRRPRRGPELWTHTGPAGRSGPGPRVEYLSGDLLRDELGLGGFDVVLLGWGLRYVEDVRGALRRLAAMLRPNGRMVVLEFTHPRSTSWAAPAQFYFKEVLPTVGSWLARDAELHEYLRISAASFFTAEGLARTLREARLQPYYCHSHLGGLVTVVAAGRPA